MGGVLYDSGGRTQHGLAIHLGEPALGSGSCHGVHQADNVRRFKFDLNFRQSPAAWPARPPDAPPLAMRELARVTAC